LRGGAIAHAALKEHGDVLGLFDLCFNRRFGDDRASALLAPNQSICFKVVEPLSDSPRTDLVFLREFSFWQEIAIGPKQPAAYLESDVLNQGFMRPRLLKLHSRSQLIAEFVLYSISISNDIIPQGESAHS
jgi:hypothetical protein